MLQVILNLIFYFFVMLSPLSYSQRALSASDPAPLSWWLRYWCVLACALLAEYCLAPVLAWIPYYAFMRGTFVISLVASRLQKIQDICVMFSRFSTASQHIDMESVRVGLQDKIKDFGMAFLRYTINRIVYFQRLQNEKRSA